MRREVLYEEGEGEGWRYVRKHVALYEEIVFHNGRTEMGEIVIIKEGVDKSKEVLEWGMAKVGERN
jgi:hypothetical protein